MFADYAKAGEERRVAATDQRQCVTRNITNTVFLHKAKIRKSN